MPAADPNSVTRRLLACLEAFSHEEDHAACHDDWPALAALLERELALTTRLADGAGTTSPSDGGVAPSADVLEKVERLRERHRELAARIDAARAAANAELSEMGSARRRLHAVRGAYGA
jgi:hypothetical protein